MNVLTVTGPGDDLHVRVELAHHLGGLDIRLRIIRGDHKIFRLTDLGRVQNFRAHRVAIKHRHTTETARQFDGFHRSVEGDKLDVLRPQNPRNDLPHPAHAGDHHARRVRVDRAEFLGYFHRLHFWADQPCAKQQQQRRHGHRQGDSQHQQVIQTRLEQTLIAPDLEHHKRELTPCREHDAESNRTDLVQATGQASHHKQQRQLQADQQQRQPQHGNRRAEQQTQIGTHADADEKQPEQQAFERFDLRFQFMAIFRIGQQQTGKKCPQCHRHTDQIHQPRGADHHQ